MSLRDQVMSNVAHQEITIEQLPPELQALMFKMLTNSRQMLVAQLEQVDIMIGLFNQARGPITPGDKETIDTFTPAVPDPDAMGQPDGGA